MKVLLFLNGPEGCQMGIEDGFSSLQKSGMISTLKWFYYNDYSAKHSVKECLNEILNISKNYNPDLIVFFHICDFPISINLIDELKKIPSKPIIAYDEGDMYGGISKRVSKSMKVLFKNADIVSIRGLGKWYDTVKKYNKNVIYIPHSNSLIRYTNLLDPKQSIEENIIFIGNRAQSRLGRLYRLPGAWAREKFVFKLGHHFNRRIKIYGDGWQEISANMGKLEFTKQVEVCANSLIHVSYEHYPNIPYYFSDRLPIALASGQIYVCHYHQGYENIFRECDFIYFFKDIDESIDIINFLLSLDRNQLLEKCKKAKKFSDQFLSPFITWQNFIIAIESLKESDRQIIHLK